MFEFGHASEDLDQKESPVVWGARAIANRGYIDIPPDRMQLNGKDEDREVFMVYVNGDGRPHKLAMASAEAWLRWDTGCRGAPERVLFEDDLVKYVGRYSGGYFYLTAFVKKGMMPAMSAICTVEDTDPRLKPLPMPYLLADNGYTLLALVGDGAVWSVDVSTRKGEVVLTLERWRPAEGYTEREVRSTHTSSKYKSDKRKIRIWAEEVIAKRGLKK